jgi:hypothetical protein
MVNLGLNWSSLLGIALVVAGAGLYFLRTWRPKLARDHDIFFAAIGLLCGGILLFQGWRLDPILAFGQFLLTGSAIFFAVESINLRGSTIAQAKSRAPIVDEDRPVSRQYSYVEAELDEIEPVEEYPINRRIRGSQDSRASRETYSDDEPRRSRDRRGSTTKKPDVGDRAPRRPSRPESPPREGYDDWGTPADDENRPPRARGNRPTPPEDIEPETRSTRPRKSRPSSGETRPRRNVDDIDVTSADYVEFRPVDDRDEDRDNPT